MVVFKAMRRLLLGVVVGGFLALIGVQSAHSHEAVGSGPCQVCALGSQTVRHAPAAAPCVVRAPVTAEVPEPAFFRLSPVVRCETSARAPPAADPS